MPAFLAVSPLLVVFLLLVLYRWPAKKTMPVALAVTVVVAAFYWRIPAATIASLANRYNTTGIKKRRDHARLSNL